MSSVDMSLNRDGAEGYGSSTNGTLIDSAYAKRMLHWLKRMSELDGSGVINEIACGSGVNQSWKNRDIFRVCHLCLKHE